MWPWEHVGVGYLSYSLACRALGRTPPSDGPVVVLIAGALLPDLVDKTLSWGLGWFPSGYAAAHSVFLAVPLGLAAIARNRRLGVAFAVGYWTHLLGDVVNPVRTGDPVDVTRVLWPVVAADPYTVDRGLGRGLLYLREFLAAIPTLNLANLFLLVALPVFTALIWVLDGMPAAAYPWRLLRAIRRRRS